MNGKLTRRLVRPHCFDGCRTFLKSAKHFGVRQLAAALFRTPIRQSGLLGPLALLTLFLATGVPATAAPAAIVSGDLLPWHCVTITFDGPPTAENAPLNPFKDYRLNVMFSHAERRIFVPGYYAADGNAAQTGAASGNKWRVHFAPPAPGDWTYRAEFHAGPNIAASTQPREGNPTAFDGAHGTFKVAPNPKDAPDALARGPLRASGERYPRFENGDPFIKGGAASPENLLACADFDQTRPTHRFAPHVRDWRPGDPTWREGQGKGIIGALNYLAGRGMNSVRFLTMNVRGDGNDVWPWTTPDERYRFDCAKLDQWEIVFSQMDRLGLAPHLVMQEAGNDHLLDGGFLGLQRKLYYRELVARFGHHPGVTWNLGDEIGNTPEQIRGFAQFLRDLDVERHPIVVHARQSRLDEVLGPLLGDARLAGVSLAIAAPNKVYAETRKWLGKAAAARRPWVVGIDEIGGAKTGALPDPKDPARTALRQQGLWGNLMAGGGGVEWRFGSADNRACEDWRSRERLWDQTGHALEFFRREPALTRAAPHDELLTRPTPGAHCLATPGRLYAVYLPGGGTAELDLGGVTADFAVQWFNPHQGGEPADGSVKTVHGPGKSRLGIMPADPGNDWVVLVKRLN